MDLFPSDGDLPKVEVHVTELCNNRCTFCSTGWINGEASPSELRPVPREIVRRQLEEAFAKGARRALFQGGEPTMRRDLGDLLADAHDVGYQATTVFTNARMAASKAGARWLVSMGVTWFQVSFQGGTAEAHDASVAAKGAFAQTLAGTRRLLELGQRVKINAVLTRHLLDSLPEFARLMIELEPEEVGLDTIKPSSAFSPERESYARLAPPLSAYAPQLRDALLAMNEAGLLAHATSLAPCLLPGAEHLVSEEPASTQTRNSDGRSLTKMAWKRSLMVKSEACSRCAYDDRCGGVYRPYAEANGTGELRPLERVFPPSPPPPRRARDAALTRALRSLLLRPRPGERHGVRAVRRLLDGSHEIELFGPAGDVRVELSPHGESPRFARTGRFDVRYRGGAGADPRLVEALVRVLRAGEPRLAALEALEEPPDEPSPADSPEPPTSRSDRPADEG